MHASLLSDLLYNSAKAGRDLMASPMQATIRAAASGASVEGCLHGTFGTTPPTTPGQSCSSEESCEASCEASICASGCAYRLHSASKEYVWAPGSRADPVCCTAALQSCAWQVPSKRVASLMEGLYVSGPAQQHFRREWCPQQLPHMLGYACQSTSYSQYGVDSNRLNHGSTSYSQSGVDSNRLNN